MPLKPYSLTKFTCDSCQGEFKNQIAYSYAANLSQLDDGYYTYCSNCVKLDKLDKRNLKKSGRVKQFNTSVREKWLTKLKTIAFKDNLKYVEVLEKTENLNAKRSVLTLFN